MSIQCYKLYTYKSPQFVLLEVSPHPKCPNFLILFLGSRQSKSVEGRIFKRFSSSLCSTMRHLQVLNPRPGFVLFVFAFAYFRKELEDFSWINNDCYCCPLYSYDLFIRLGWCHYFGYVFVCGGGRKLLYFESVNQYSNIIWLWDFSTTLTLG